MQAAHGVNGSATLAISLELSVRSWKLEATDCRRERPSEFTLKAEGAQDRLLEVRQAAERLKAQWKLADCQVAVIYEAGQDGHWIARAMAEWGWQVHVVDPASVPVPRQARRVKTDRIDARMLLKVLLDWLRGERGTVRMIHLPGVQAEAQRHLARERGVLQKEIGAHRDRMRKLLRTVGCWQELQPDGLLQQVQSGQLRCWNGLALPQELTQRLVHECQRLQLVQDQFEKMERTRLEQLPEPVRQKIRQLAQLKAIGEIGASRLVMELFWREFSNRRQVGSCVGLVAQPYDSGDSHADQGISKQGNRRVRALLIELAWMWLRWQPQSELSVWFARRTQGSNKRGKRIMIVAVARRLVIALWRYLSHGELPAGARLKTA